jgi:phage tail P2-like protein
MERVRLTVILKPFVERLPWLAWALSVDTWDSDWPESTKRSLIANSVQIHKTKGTVSAIERVMDALGVTAELREWFEYLLIEKQSFVEP